MGRNDRSEEKVGVESGNERNTVEDPISPSTRRDGSQQQAACEKHLHRPKTILTGLLGIDDVKGTDGHQGDGCICRPPAEAELAAQPVDAWQYQETGKNGK